MPNSSAPNLNAIAAGFLFAYQERNRVFGSQLINSPAWEIMLILQLVGRPVPATRLVTSIDASDSIVRRWIAVLVDENLIARAQDSIEESYFLTEKAQQGLTIALKAALKKPQLDQDQLPVFTMSDQTLDVRVGSLRTGLTLVSGTREEA